MSENIKNEGNMGLLFSAERELSLPKLMKDGQFTGRDQQEWLNLVMEASGANQQIDDMKASLLNYNKKRIF